MKAEILNFGASRTQVVVVDDFSGALNDIRALAGTLAPFPPDSRTRYPGVRQHLLPSQPEAFAYVVRTIQSCVQLIGSFGFQAFALQDASFSMVTMPPESLGVAQRRPHIDQTDPDYLAILHYLSDTPASGTAFYRQVATGFECITEGNVAVYRQAVEDEPEPFADAYMAGSNACYEEIGFVEAVPDRLIIYPGNLLHSGIIPPTMNFSADPLTGRLTGNMFVKGTKKAGL